MAKNVLETSFIFNDRDSAKVDTLFNKLTTANDKLNNLGKNSLVGKNIADSIKPAETALDSLTKKVDDSVQKPTISRYWETEETKTIGSLKAIENAVNKTNNLFSGAGSSPAMIKPATVLPDLPKVAFKTDEKNFIDLERIQKKADGINKSFAEISASRLNGGQIGTLTKEIVVAQERSKQLASDIRNIKTELGKTTSKSSIRFLTEELQAAEREADQLNRKLNTLPVGAGAGKGIGANNLRLSSFQKQNLSYQVNDVLTGIASGQNLTQIAAQQSGQIAQIFNPAQASALVAAYAPLVGILAAGAASIALVYKITGDLRAEAEKRLKIEENLSKEYTKQNKARKEAINDLRDAETAQKFGRSFAGELKNLDDEALKRRQETFRKTFSFNPVGESAEKAQNSILAINDELARRQDERRRQADEAFNQRNENFKKSQTGAIVLENKLQVEIEKSKIKVGELGKAYKSVFDSLAQKSASNNPFVSLFFDSRIELEKLKESLKGLPEEMQRAAIASQQAINRNKLFETRLDNNLSAFDLRETAEKFRNPNQTEAENARLREIVQRSIDTKNSYGEFITRQNKILNKNGDINLTREQERSIYEVEQLRFLRGDGGVNDRSLISRLARERVNGFDQNISLNERLQKQLSIINSGVSTESERGIADRRLIGLSNGLDPAQIKADLREQIAAANEREAVRKENYERELLRVQTEDLDVNRKILANQEKLLKIAEKDGLEGLNKFLEITVRDETRGGVTTGSSGTQTDVRNNYFND